MKLYRIAGGTNWYGTQADAKAGARELGRTFEQVEVPTDKEGLLNWLNSNTVIDGHAEDVQLDPLEQAELRAVEAAQAQSTVPVAAKPPLNTPWETSDIMSFILERASVAQVESIFQSLGAIFKEMANERSSSKA